MIKEKVKSNTVLAESGMFFIDFKQAFDSVDHDILLDKIERMTENKQTKNMI